VDHVYQIFKPFAGMPPKCNLIGVAPVTSRVTRRVKTYSPGTWGPLYDPFYPRRADVSRVKRVPLGIADLLTARGLAHWPMDDGTTTTPPGRKRYTISTQGFSREDQILLVQALASRFNVRASLQVGKSYFRIKATFG
jgi:hypothetical protein